MWGIDYEKNQISYKYYIYKYIFDVCCKLYDEYL